MQNFQTLLESPFIWFMTVFANARLKHRISVERRQKAELRRRYMNG